MPTVAYRAIRSRRKFIKSKEIKAYLGAHLDSDVKPRLVRRFDLIVANWHHKPEFRARKYITADFIKVHVYPAGPNKQIYKWVTGGTKPHPIPKHGPGFLAFVWGGPGSYKAKTKPVGQFGGPGVVVGGTLRSGVMQVQHPGTEARKFEESVRNDAKRWYSRTMENAWRRAIRSV